MCKNSWGTGWGDQGYFCIAYGDSYIDSWNVYGVDAIENTGWRQNARVVGLWAINEDRNAWVYFDGYGWRKVSPDNDNIFLDLSTPSSITSRLVLPTLLRSPIFADIK